MKRIIFSLIFVFSASVFSVSAQSARTGQIFESGIIDAGKSNFEAALSKFQKSLETAENERADTNFLAKIHFNIGVCLYRMKNQFAAVNAFERAIGLNRNYEKSFYALGMAQFELKNLARAERAFRSALNLNEQNGETWFDLAFVYLANRDYASAKTAFEKAVAFKSVSSAVGRNNLGVIFALEGDFSAAIAEFEKAFKSSNSKLRVAARNLQFCKTYKQNSGRDLIAKLEFGKE